MVNRTSCYTRKGVPLYRSSRIGTAKRVHLGKKKGVYYHTSKHAGKVHKNYIGKQCIKHGTADFWNTIDHMRHGSKRKQSKKMGTREEWEKLDADEIKHRADLLKMHSNLENIGLPKDAFFHDICYYLNDLKKLAQPHGQWDSAGLMELDSIVPLLTVSKDGGVSHIGNNKWASGVWFGQDRLTRGTKIAAGKFGILYNGTFNGTPISLKVAKMSVTPTPEQIVSVYRRKHYSRRAVLLLAETELYEVPR